MSYIWLPIGLALPTLSGWLIIRLCEAKKSVLSPMERWAIGFVLGGTGMMYLTFLAHVVGLIDFTVIGFASIQVVVTAMLGALYWKFKPITNNESTILSSEKFSTIQKTSVAILAVWLALKIIASIVLLSGPAYFDDTLNNWNLRAKSYVEAHKLVLEIDPGRVGVGSYPPTVPMEKAWLTLLNGGEWNEGLVNMIHVLWYLAAIGLVFCALQRVVGRNWAIIGAYILSSLPLYLVHGAVAYGDLFLSVHIFLAVIFLFAAVTSEGEPRQAFFRLGALAAGLLVFTKNEAILLHLPPIILLFMVSLGYLVMNRRMTKQEAMKAILWYAGLVASVLLPWLIFKWMNGLQFGNAKGITGLELQWHGDVFPAIFVNTFLEGNWNLLPGLLLALLVLRWKTAFRTSTFLLTAFVLIVIVGQLPIYVLTPLATEAVNQTGYARGMIHLVPVIVVLFTILVKDWWQNVKE